MAAKDKNDLQDMGHDAPKPHYRVMHAHVRAGSEVFEMGAEVALEGVSEDDMAFLVAAGAVEQI